MLLGGVNLRRRNMDNIELSSRSERPDAALPVRRGHSWSGVSGEAGCTRKADPYEFAWKGQTHLLVSVDFMRSDGETHVTDLAPAYDKDLRGMMTFIPSGAELSGWLAPVERRNTYTAVYLDPAMVPAAVDEADSHVDLEPRLHFRDTALSSTIAKLGALLDESNPDSVYAEMLGLLLGIEIRRTQRRAPKWSPQRHALSLRTENFVREFIEANLSRDLTLTELAELAGLSRFHFARAFKRSTGLPPHQYLLQRWGSQVQPRLRAHSGGLRALRSKSSSVSSDYYFQPNMAEASPHAATRS